MTTAIKELKNWETIFSKILKIDNYNKLKSLYSSVCSQIKELDGIVHDFAKPRNLREDSEQVHDKVKFGALTKQKERLERKLTELEESIKLDIEESKKENL